MQKCVRVGGGGSDPGTDRVKCCQADLEGRKATAKNVPIDQLPADLLVCTVLQCQSGPTYPHPAVRHLQAKLARSHRV